MGYVVGGSGGDVICVADFSVLLLFCVLLCGVLLFFFVVEIFLGFRVFGDVFVFWGFAVFFDVVMCWAVG